MEFPTYPPPTDRSYWVIEQSLLAGAYPGASVGSTVGHLVDAGITAFVNLTEDLDPASADASLDPYDRLLGDGIVLVRHPMVDLGVPPHATMKRALDEIDGLLERGLGVYVHCWGGIGRTGMVVGCWLVRHELVRPGHALAVLAQLRRTDRGWGWRRSPETDEQRTFVEAWRPGS